VKLTDPVLFVGVAVMSTAVAILSSDDAAKHIDPQTIFFTKSGSALLMQGLLALKLLRFRNGDGDGNNGKKTP